MGMLPARLRMSECTRPLRPSYIIINSADGTTPVSQWKPRTWLSHTGYSWGLWHVICTDVDNWARKGTVCNGHWLRDNDRLKAHTRTDGLAPSIFHGISWIRMVVNFPDCLSFHQGQGLVYLFRAELVLVNIRSRNFLRASAATKMWTPGSPVHNPLDRVSIHYDTK